MEFVEVIDEMNYSDEEYEVMQIITMRRKRVIRMRENFFFFFDDGDFYKRFRLTKQAAWCVYTCIKDSLRNNIRNNAIKRHEMFLMTLHFYATGGFQQTVGDMFRLSKSSICRTVKIVTEHIANLRSKFITLPEDESQIMEVQDKFKKVANFPRVIAAIDCTHVKIISPGGDDAEVYRNRKGFYSINVQTLCDSDLKILDVVAKWPGSVHDSRIFKNSRIHAHLEAHEFRNCVVLGDGGYENTNYVLTPLLSCTTASEVLYNEAHIRSRNCVERSYGVWKRRFPVLSLGIRVKTKSVPAIIVATAVLHNICCELNDTNPPELPQNINDAITNVLNVPQNHIISGRNENNYTRKTLIETYFSSL